MTCKNCEKPLTSESNFCSFCGAKVILNRLTFRNLAYEISQRVFDLDNSFFRTFAQLFVRPEMVIDSYIQGVRKRFLNPISHLGIALTLSGIIIFVMQKVMTPEMFFAYGRQLPEEVAGKLYNSIFDYSSLFFILYIPVFAVAGYLTFNRKDYLLSEYIIAYIYILSQWSIFLFPISLMVLIFAPTSYIDLSFPTLFIMIGYSVFAMQRIHRYAAAAATLRAILFFILTAIGYIGIIILFYIVMFMTGTLELQDFAPPQ